MGTPSLNSSIRASLITISDSLLSSTLYISGLFALKTQPAQHTGPTAYSGSLAPAENERYEF